MAFESFATLHDAAIEHGSLAHAALAREALESGVSPRDIRARMNRALDTMREGVATGRAGHARSRSGRVGGDAALLEGAASELFGAPFRQALSASLAVAEVNAAMGRVVAAPTGGASGVLPGVLLTVAEQVGACDDALVDALLAAAAVGGVIAARASLAGAAGGCQAEVGSASAMAAAAAVEMAGGSPAAAGHAASFALQGLLGLVCDPIGGLVEVPCVARNATGAAVALAAVEMALAGMTFPVPFDEVVDASAQIGRALPVELRETARGGLAATRTGRMLASEGVQGP